MEKNDTDESNFFRWILKNQYEYIFDDDVIELLDFFNDNEKINKFKNYKYYGRKLIKYQREW